MAQHQSTPSEDVATMIAVASIGPSDVVYDLGCGDGRLLIAAMRAGAARAVGFEIDVARVEIARLAVRTAGLADVIDIRQRSFFDADLHDASVLFLYVSPDPRIERKLWRELTPGTRVVSYSFNCFRVAPSNVVPLTVRQAYLWVWPSATDGASPIEYPIPIVSSKADCPCVTVGLDSARSPFAVSIANGLNRSIERVRVRWRFVDNSTSRSSQLSWCAVVTIRSGESVTLLSDRAEAFCRSRVREAWWSVCYVDVEW